MNRHWLVRTISGATLAVLLGGGALVPSALGAERLITPTTGATCFTALDVALLKGFYAEEGLKVEAYPYDLVTSVEKDKARWLVKTPEGLREPDFGVVPVESLHNVVNGKIDMYIVDGYNYGCMELMVPPDSDIKSVADLKGKKIAINPWWVSPFQRPHGLSFVDSSLRMAGINPEQDVAIEPIPWDAFKDLASYIQEGFKSGKFAAYGGTDPGPILLRGKNIGRYVVSNTWTQPFASSYCCLLGIKRSLVDNHPEKAAAIVRAIRKARLWTAENPEKAIAIAQAGGFYPAEVPLIPSAERVKSYGYDRQPDIAKELERYFREKIESGIIQADKTPQELVKLHYRQMAMP